jgi:hemolysin activation/secretion protein
MPLPIRHFLCFFLAMLIALPLHAQPGQASEPTFDLLELEIDGNTVLPIQAIEAAVYPFLGEGRRVSDIEAARAALKKAYADAGYPFVEVELPEQQIRDGIVRLNVVEARVSRVRVTGSRYYSQGWIRERTPALAEGEAIYAPDLQAQLIEVNRAAGLQVAPVLRPGLKPGTTEVDLRVEDQSPLAGSLELNNRYSANTTSLRLNAAVRYDNLWQRGHSVGLQYQMSPEDTSEVRAILATYAAPFPGSATSLSAYYLSSRSNVAALGSFAVAGRATIAGFRANRSFAGAPGWGHQLSGGIDYKDFDESLDSTGAGTVVTPITYAPLGLQYLGEYRTETTVSVLSTGVALGIRGLISDSQEFADKRFKADSNFLIWRWDLQHTRPLFAGATLFGRFDGQLTDQPLISNEQYFAGGQLNVRGYLEAEALGDDAVHGTVEVRSRSFARSLSEHFSEATALVFVEGARLRIRKPLPAQDDRIDLASTGVGLRIRLGQWSSLAFNVGWPFKDAPSTKAWEPRFQFTASVQM